MNILHIITGLGMGGAERVVLDLAALAKKQNHAAYVIYLSKNDDLLPAFREREIYPALYDFSRFRFSHISRLVSFINRRGIHIVHLHLAHPVLLSPVIRCFTKAKIVWTSHSFNIGSGARERYVWLLKPFRHRDILFSKEQYRRFYKKNFSVIENGIDTAAYHCDVPKNGCFTFISVGRLAKVKNQMFLVDLMDKMIHVHKKNCRLLIAGGGELREELQAGIERLRLTDHVELLGARSDIPFLLAQSHCFLLPSLWEGLPVALLEAGASGLPVISTDAGGIPSLLDGANSYMGGLEHFEENMLLVMDNYSSACEKAERLRQKIKAGYSLETIFNKHLELYRSLAGEF